MDLIARGQNSSNGKGSHHVRVDGDKSISHRAALFGGLALGTTTVRGFLPGEDTLHTAKIMQAMGVAVARVDHTTLRIEGLGLHGLQAPSVDLDCGNSGTGMRLLSGVLCGQSFASTLIGDASLTSRPMRRVIAPLRMMGADIQGTDRDTAPLKIRPVTTIKGIDYVTPVASAQVKSCVLLAALYAQGASTVTESEATRDHSERMLAAFGADIEYRPGYAKLTPGSALLARDIEVPADPSSAAFFAVAAAICEGKEITLREVCINSTRTGLFTCLQEMGAELRYENQRILGAEPVADIVVKGQGLRGIRVAKARVVDMIDEFPIFFIAASLAHGESIVEGAEELRVKESDRIGAMVRGLQSLGVEVEERSDGVRIVGKPSGLGSGPVSIDSRGDHRIAMSFAIGSLRCQHDVKILDCDNIATSFPSFVSVANAIGADLRTA